jgi:hypothetical protein
MAQLLLLPLTLPLLASYPSSLLAVSLVPLLG